MNQARAPDKPGRLHPPPATTVDEVAQQLAVAITQLIRLSTQDVAVTREQLDKLRERRHQLSAVIDGLTRFSKPGG